MDPIYLDYNATTPIDPRAAQAMLLYLHTHFGNPSSSHVYGARAKGAVERARGQVAEMLGCLPSEIVFTSGGTESNNYAIKGVADAYRTAGDHIVTSAVEHPAVIQVCGYLWRRGRRVTVVGVDANGRVDPEDVEAAMTPGTILVTVMHANNEVGTVQPIAEIAEIAHRHGALVHSDCAQSVGKLPVNVDDLGVDLLSIAGHKVYGPKGVGALYVRSGVLLEPLMHGADHEAGRRGGTENVIEIVGLGEACAAVSEGLDAYAAHMSAMRDAFEAGLRERVADLRIHGAESARLPNTSSVSFPGLRAAAVLSELQQVAASAGAACHGEGDATSSVLRAMGVRPEEAQCTLRFSVGRDTTQEEIDRAVDAIAEAIGRMLGSAAPSPGPGADGGNEAPSPEPGADEGSAAPRPGSGADEGTEVEASEVVAGAADGSEVEDSEVVPGADGDGITEAST